MKTFEVQITKTSYSWITIEVQANTEKEAEKIALNGAGDHTYLEKSAEYNIDYTDLKTN